MGLSEALVRAARLLADTNEVRHLLPLGSVEVSPELDRMRRDLDKARRALARTVKRLAQESAL